MSKIQVERAYVPKSAVWSEAKLLLRMGFAFMITGLIVSSVGYITRVMVLRNIGLGAAGLYQAALTLSTVYVGFILSGMGAFTIRD